MVELVAIKFNHDPGSAAADALNIRRNASDSVAVPEWQRGLSINPEDSPAAYAIAETHGNTLTIQAQLFRKPAKAKALPHVQVRAIDANLDAWWLQGCLGIFADCVRVILRLFWGNVLGELKPRAVTFQANGFSAFESFELCHVRLWSRGVGVRTTTWRWQYRKKAWKPWVDFATSEHRIYSLLEVPKAPWQQQPCNAWNTQLPWTEVLDYACRWAWRVTTRDEAAGSVTAAVYALGPATVTYDCPGGGSSHYALWSGFDGTAFLDRLKGGPGNGIYVNCTDCATITSTFANALGCDLWQSRMGYGFDLNPLLGIGSTVWQTACGWGGFSYHEVAWKDACDVGDPVFDACLQVDGDADPTAADPAHTALLPVNLRFGNAGEGDYRDRLAAPSGRASCNPQPGTRMRRSLV